MELENKIEELGATSNMQVSMTVNKIVEQMEEAKGMAWRIRQKNTEYKVGDKVIVPGVGNFDKVLRCETAGTTADTAFPGDYNSISIGDVIGDGTVEWGVVDLVTVPDTPDAPVASVNGKTGDVVLTAGNVGALPTAGGTMEGVITTKNNTLAKRNTSDSFLYIYGATAKTDGAYILMTSKAYSENSYFEIGATNKARLIGDLNGNLTWNGKHIVRSVDGVNAGGDGNVTLNALLKSGGIISGNLAVTGNLTKGGKHVLTEANSSVVVESWRADDGSSWYRKWSDGWIEQGGILDMGSEVYSADGVPVNFRTDMTDTQYSICLCPVISSGTGLMAMVETRDFSSMTIKVRHRTDYASYFRYVSWYICGK